jgi:hypothetical protein
MTRLQGSQLFRIMFIERSLRRLWCCTDWSLLKQKQSSEAAVTVDLTTQNFYVHSNLLPHFHELSKIQDPPSLKNTNERGLNEHKQRIWTQQRVANQTDFTVSCCCIQAWAIYFTKGEDLKCSVQASQYDKDWAT